MTIDSIEWDKLQPMSMPTFLDRFTLHDSSFHRINIDDDRRVTVEVEIDSVWNSSIPKGFETLALRFEEPYRVSWVRASSDMFGGGQDVTVAESVVLDSAERDALLVDTDFQPREEHPSTSTLPQLADDPSLTLTTLEFVNGDKLSILHGGAVRVVVVDSGSATVDVSTLPGQSTEDREAIDRVWTPERRAEILKRVREWRKEFGYQPTSMFRAGQVWAIKAPTDQPNATLTVLRVENDGKVGTIIHIAVSGVSYGNGHTTIQHLPFTQAAVERSITTIERHFGPIPDFALGYRRWREEWDAGSGDVFSITVADAIDAVTTEARNRK